MKRERDPTPEEFEKLLSWLSADREEAGAKYEAIRRRMIRIFVTRGCCEAERLTDEVLNRVAVRVDKLALTYDDAAKCCYGFVDFLCREYWRDPAEQAFDDQLLQSQQPDEHDQKRLEQEDACLAQCLAELSPEDSDLFCRYFADDERSKIDVRKSLAGELGLTANALRIKAYRIRRKLRLRMLLCLQRFVGE
jgi:hypothetical protein